MKILIGKDIKGADKATLARQDIDSLELMERASEVIAQWLCNNVEQENQLLFIIGKGNNGGDGLAVARMMANAGFKCAAKLLYDKAQMSEECSANLDRLPDTVNVFSAECGMKITENDVIIDAMLGSGVDGVVRDPVARVIKAINGLNNRVIAIDLPSGMPTEFLELNADEPIVMRAETTLAIECPKLAMMLPTFGEYAGKIEVLPIDIDEDYKSDVEDKFHYITADDIRLLMSEVKPRSKFGYKNQYGHALLVCGSRNMMGASILATSAALRSGCGLVTVHIPESERFAMNASCPSAILSLDNKPYFATSPCDINKYASIGVGCGLGADKESVTPFGELLRNAKEQNIPMVLDADALNIISSDSSLRKLIPFGSVLTPHIGELRRLCSWNSDEEMIDVAMELARELQSVVVVKGAHTMICTPDGRAFFNSTGCPGMAKGGMGDVLTGFITGLMARGYDSLSASVVGVYLHGVGGCKAAAYYGEESMNSSDIIDFLAEAMVEI